MSDTAGRWIPIGNSSLLQRWRAAAGVLCAAIAAALLVKAIGADAPALPLLAGAALAVTAAWIAVDVARAGTPRRDALAVRVDDDGVIRLRTTRNGAQDECEVLGPLFVSSQLLVLSAPGRAVPLWRDAIAGEVFRRIAVASRWPRKLPPAPDSASSGPGIA